MTVDEFNYKFAKQGGFSQFYKMLFDDNATYRQISSHFKISATLIRSYIKDLFEKKPDTRLERRARRVNAILEYMKTHSEYESKIVFKFDNEEYLTEALFLAYQMGIYKDFTPLPIPHSNIPPATDPGGSQQVKSQLDTVNEPKS